MIAAAADVRQWNHTLINNTLNKLLMKKEEIKSEEKANLRKIENEAQLGNVMNEDNELLFGCGCGCGCGSGSGSGCGSGCGCGCGCGCGSGSGSGSGSGCGSSENVVKKSLGTFSKSLSGSCEGANYYVSIKGSIQCSATKTYMVDEDGNMISSPDYHVSGKISLSGQGRNNPPLGVHYTNSGFSTIEQTFESGALYDIYTVSPSPTITITPVGSSATPQPMSLHITVTYSLIEDANGSIENFMSDAYLG